MGTPDAFEESLLVPSPNTDGNRPYAMSMHSALVKSVLKSLRLSMTTDNHAFDFAAYEPHFVEAATRGLTANGRAYFAAVQAFERGDFEGSAGIVVSMHAQQVHDYYARHESPALLFLVGGHPGDFVRCPLCKCNVLKYETKRVHGKQCCQGDLDGSDCRARYLAYKSKHGEKKAKKWVRTGRKP